MSYWLVVVGATMLGFQIPEFMAAILKQRIPLIVNIWWATAFGMISAGLMS